MRLKKKTVDLEPDDPEVDKSRTQSSDHLKLMAFFDPTALSFSKVRLLATRCVAVGQNQRYHFGVGAPPILEPILVGIGMFTGGTIWILTHLQTCFLRVVEKEFHELDYIEWLKTFDQFHEISRYCKFRHCLNG